MMPLAEMRSIVLAAGLGTRMRPLTDHKPKPLVQVGGKALIDHVLDWLSMAGVQRAVVNTHYLAAQLEAHLAARQTPAITLSHEELLLETGGGIAKALPVLGEGVFVSANSDTICLNGKTHALARLHEAWDESRMDALLLLQPVERAVGYNGAGDFFLTPSGALQRKGKSARAPYVFTGVQLLHPRLFAAAPGGAFSMNVLYNRGGLESGELPRIHGLVHDGKWLHVGEPSAIALAEKAMNG